MSLDDADRAQAIEAAASAVADPAVGEHIRQHAHVSGRRVWLAEVCSEDDPALTAKLRAELGYPEPSGYMSEERGWDLGMVRL